MKFYLTYFKINTEVEVIILCLNICSLDIRNSMQYNIMVQVPAPVVQNVSGRSQMIAFCSLFYFTCTGEKCS